MADYITLVNQAIIESGADLDPIEAGDFTSPSDSMSRKFKQWMTRSWRELQQENNSWHYMSKQAQFIINPRLLVVDGDRATAPPVDSEYLGEDTGASFVVTGTTLLEGVWATGSAVAIVEYKELEGQFKWNEFYNEVLPDVSEDDVFRVKWWGRYDFHTTITDMLEPNITTFFIQSTGGSATQDNTASADNGYLINVPWAQWLAQFEGDQTSRGRPRYFTTTPDGWYDFWPRPDEQYVLTFTYSAKPQELEDDDDEPEGLDANYQDILVWSTVMKWADYQERPSQFARAERMYERYKNRMERNLKPQWGFSPNEYNCG